MSALEFALAYRELGLSVIPVMPTGKRKSPHAGALHEVHGTSTWKPFRDQPATKDEIRGWYQVAPDAGVAILTGCVGDVLVADIDDRGSAPSLPTTPIVTTGRGFHVYLRGQARKRKTAYGDLLGSGSYAIAPPSRHPMVPRIAGRSRHRAWETSFFLRLTSSRLETRRISCLRIHLPGIRE